MRLLKVYIIIFITTLIISVAAYFFIMQINGNTKISASSTDWGAFGSYISGIATPLASILSGYLIYRTLTENAHQQKVEIARASIDRLDRALEERFNTTIHSFRYGPSLQGVTLRELIYHLSDNEKLIDESARSMMLAIAHNISILAKSIHHYTKMADRINSHEDDCGWLGELERSYWIEKYSPVCNRIIKIVGKEAIIKKFSKEQMESFTHIFRAGKEIY